jgi:hypothetical protein
MKLFIAVLLVFGLAGEARAETIKYGIKNYPDTPLYGYCIDGVEYWQFARSITPRFNKNGKIATCDY